MSIRSRERSYRVVMHVLSAAAIVVGILSLLGVRPMNSRMIEVVLGTASLVAGVALLTVIMRAKPVPSSGPVDNS